MAKQYYVLIYHYGKISKSAYCTCQHLYVTYVLSLYTKQLSASCSELKCKNKHRKKNYGNLYVSKFQLKIVIITLNSHELIRGRPVSTILLLRCEIYVSVYLNGQRWFYYVFHVLASICAHRAEAGAGWSRSKNFRRITILTSFFLVRLRRKPEVF